MRKNSQKDTQLTSKAETKRSPKTKHQYDSRDRHLSFERFISDLSARFATLSLTDVDQEIEQALKQVLEFFQGDRCVLLEDHPDRKFGHVTHAYYAQGIEHIAGDINLTVLFPWGYERLKHGVHISFTRTNELPPEAVTDRQSWEAMGVRSSLDIPVLFDNRINHAITIQTLRYEHVWPEEYVPRLRLLGEIFVSAIARKRADEALRESEERLSLAADSAGAMLWSLNMDSGHIWATEKTKKFFGFTPDSEVDFESFLNVVHPEDREEVRRIVEEAIHSGNDSSTEYRLVKPDGRIRWIMARGRPYAASPGQSARLMGVAIDITERKEAEEALKMSEAALRTSRQDLQRLAGRLITAQEEELRRLSRDLHDDLTQKLAVLAIEAGKLELEMKGGRDSAASRSKKISEIKDQLIRLSEEVHQMSRQLHPSIIDDLGLVRAIESECVNFSRRENVQVTFIKEDVLPHIPKNIALCLYRIVQESLKNITKHSRARSAEISLKSADNSIFLTIRDQGIGFDLQEVREKRGLGLASMRERVQLVRGDFSVECRPGDGTVISVRVPLTGEGG